MQTNKSSCSPDFSMSKVSHKCLYGRTSEIFLHSHTRDLHRMKIYRPLLLHARRGQVKLFLHPVDHLMDRHKCIFTRCIRKTLLNLLTIPDVCGLKSPRLPHTSSFPSVSHSHIPRARASLRKPCPSPSIHPMTSQFFHLSQAPKS